MQHSTRHMQRHGLIMTSPLISHLDHRPQLQQQILDNREVEWRAQTTHFAQPSSIIRKLKPLLDIASQILTI
jgi:hypothetical protein